MLWSKQFYHYDVERLAGRRPGRAAAAAASASTAATRDWRHLNNADVISMPDKWEYPGTPPGTWPSTASRWRWSTRDFAKRQLDPAAARVVHASQRPAARLRVGLRRRQSAGARLGRLARLQDRAQRMTGDGDRAFLERVFHKLLLNFTWWVNRKDADGQQRLPGRLPRPRQHRRLRPQRAAARPAATSSRPTAPRWMGMYCLNMLAIALELARDEPRLRGHRHQVLRALPVHRRGAEQHRRRGHPAVGRRGRVLLRRAAPARTASSQPLKVRSLVGLIPLLAVETIEPRLLEQLPDFKRAHGLVPRPPARPGRAWSRAGRSRAWASGACWRWCAATG